MNCVPMCLIHHSPLLRVLGQDYLKAAFDDWEHFDDVQKLVLQFDSRHAEAIKKIPEMFQGS